MIPNSILIVEDNEIKRDNLIELLKESYGECSIECAASVMSAVRIVKRSALDLIILDMTLPNYDVTSNSRSGGTHPLGGVEFLKQVKRRKISSKVIVFTQYETFGRPPNERDLTELNHEMLVGYSENYVGAVYYHATIADWEKQLKNMIETIE